MVILGIVLVIVGGAIFATGESGRNCLSMLVGGIVNILGFALIFGAFS